MEPARGMTMISNITKGQKLVESASESTTKADQAVEYLPKFLFNKFLPL